MIFSFFSNTSHIYIYILKPITRGVKIALAERKELAPHSAHIAQNRGDDTFSCANCEHFLPLCRIVTGLLQSYNNVQCRCVDKRSDSIATRCRRLCSPKEEAIVTLILTFVYV